jgi:hypothetical protein
MLGDIAELFYSLPDELQSIVMKHTTLRHCILLNYDYVAKQQIQIHNIRDVISEAILSEDYTTIAWLYQNNFITRHELYFMIQNGALSMLIFLYDICDMQYSMEWLIRRATNCNALSIVKYLSKRNNYYTYNAIYMATIQGYLPLIMFLEENCDVINKERILSIAAENKLTDIIKYFGSRDYIADPSLVQHTAYKGDTDTVKCLVEYCAGPVTNETIYYAVMSGNVELVEYLFDKIRHGDPGYLDDAMDYAIQSEDYDMITCLMNNTDVSYEDAVMRNVESIGRPIEEFDIFGYIY